MAVKEIILKELIQEQFGFQLPEISRMNGYDNANYLIKNKEEAFIFKTYKYNKQLFDILRAEIDALIFLHHKNKEKFPKPISFINGDFVKLIDIEGKKTICRMLSYIDGELLGNMKHSKELFQSIGVFLAEMDIMLQQFDTYVLRARQSEWDLQYLHLNIELIDDIVDTHDQSIVRYFFQQYEENVRPVLHKFRKQIIHNDANEWNILIKDGKLNGIIDFGDISYTQLINELAIAITYTCFDKDNPLKWASYIIKSYHCTLPIEEQEVEVLYYLIAARLCTSVCNSAHSRKINPENIYAVSSEKNAWKMLYKWIEIGPIAAEKVFREAIGLDVKNVKTVEEDIEKRNKFISPILSLSYKQPISMAGSAFQYMYDTQGNSFLDAYNNIPHVGHSHPKVVAAGQKQMAKLNTNTRYLYDILPTYAEKLLSQFPDSLSKVFFVNSGSAASDLAMRMAYAHTNHKKIMVMEHGYHGNTQMAMDISDYKFSHKKGSGQKNNILKTPIPDTYSGKYKVKDGHAGSLYAKEAIESIKASDEPIATFISEPIVGCGGQIPLAKGYLKELYPAIREQGGVCISDEVQTGFGRLGDYFWGYEAQDVVPDIVILGKPMANGHPMGAVVTTNEIAESFSKGVEFFSSFGGNPVSCAVGLSVLEVIEEEKLQENAKLVGDFYKSLFINLKKEYPCIGDVRGSGLFIGVELVKNKSLEPYTEPAHYIKNELRNRSILISTDGPFDNVLKTKPPLCFTKANAQYVVDNINEVLKKFYSE